jgi:hypothetical protein
MTDYVTEWLTLDFPKTVRLVDETLKSYGLPQTHAETFRLLVGLLVGVGSTAQKDGPRGEHPLFTRLGYAFHGLGGGDEELALRYMQAAHAAARDVYRWDISILNTEWGHIGLWRA